MWVVRAGGWAIGTPGWEGCEGSEGMRVLGR